MSYFDISSAAFNGNLRMLESTDPCHADTFNPLFQQLINNDVAIMRAAGQFAGDKNGEAEFLLNMRKTGLKYGVHWDDFSVNPSSIGTRLYDNVGKVCKPSTDTERARNDLEGESVFFHLEVNGEIDENGDFQVKYIKGIDNEFDNKTMDTWCLYLPQWISISIDANGETKVLSDTKYDGYFIEGGAIRTDKTIRPFVPIAKYQMSKNDDGVASSISGRAPAHNQSHNNMITTYHAKGTQYCGTTMQDWERMNNLFDIAFATRNSQSIMQGCLSYYLQYQATVLESDVERIIISKSNARNLVVGSAVSIGNATALNDSKPNNDRGQAGIHAKANRVIITKIDDYDDNNSAVYVDNGGTKFSTASTVVSNVECPCMITTMEWHTGSCDGVLGSCGSVHSNTDAKCPYILFGVEYALGLQEILGNTVLKIADGVMRAYICYDCTKLSSSAPTDDYIAVAYTIPNTKVVWRYIAKTGYDPDNPMVRMCEEFGATSSNGYADGVYTENFTSETTGSREIRLGGNLGGGAFGGRRYEYLFSGLGGANWAVASRLSASGRCAQAAA